MKPKEALEKAVELVGSQSELARRLGAHVTQAHVWNWINRGRVPPEWAARIEAATNGAVRCEDLRPDVDWAYLRGSQSVVAQEAGHV